MSPQRKALKREWQWRWTDRNEIGTREVPVLDKDGRPERNEDGRVLTRTVPVYGPRFRKLGAPGFREWSRQHGVDPRAVKRAAHPSPHRKARPVRAVAPPQPKKDKAEKKAAKGA